MRASYRPPRVTPRPRIHGLLTGIVEQDPEQESGKYARIDERGRYKNVTIITPVTPLPGTDSQWESQTGGKQSQLPGAGQSGGSGRLEVDSMIVCDMPRRLARLTPVRDLACSLP